MPNRILLCDDELYVLRAAEIKFKRAGYEVHCASDGEDAWAKLNANAIDIVVTDCQMPRLDGLQLAKRINESAKYSGTPVVMLTAKGFELSEEQLRNEYGICTLFAKPFSPRALQAAVSDILNASKEAEASSDDNQVEHTTT